MIVLPVGLFAAWVLLSSLWLLGRLREWHHGYLGLVLWLAGLWLSPALAWVGLVVLVDDAVQHFVQVFHPPFISPMHWAYGTTLWRWAWVRRLNRWLDRRL